MLAMHNVHRIIYYVPYVRVYVCRCIHVYMYVYIYVVEVLI